MRSNDNRDCINTISYSSTLTIQGKAYCTRMSSYDCELSKNKKRSYSPNHSWEVRHSRYSVDAFQRDTIVTQLQLGRKQEIRYRYTHHITCRNHKSDGIFNANVEKQKVEQVLSAAFRLMPIYLNFLGRSPLRSLVYMCKQVRLI